MVLGRALTAHIYNHYTAREKIVKNLTYISCVKSADFYEKMNIF